MPNEFYYSFHRQHRSHQVAALRAIRSHRTGQVCAPCGTGKTRIQVSAHLEDMLEKTEDGERGIYVIASHRLSLNKELLDELVDKAGRCNLEFDILFIGSNASEYLKNYPQRSLATTNELEATFFIKKSKELNRHVIVVSTYDSIHRLVGLDSFARVSLITCDECHTAVSEGYVNNIKSVKHLFDREYYFTATRCPEMDDVPFYGEVIFTASPKDVLAAAEIASPKIHKIFNLRHKISGENNVSMMVQYIIETYEAHRVAVKNNSVLPDKIGATLLISFPSIKIMEEVYNHRNFILWCKMDGIQHACCISSNGAWYNWKAKNSQSDFFVELNKKPDEEDCLLFNVDMLTEGINLSSVTGVMPMKGMNKNRLIQLLGRCLRLNKEDKKNIYSGDVKPNDYFKYIKPYGFIVIAGDLETFSNSNGIIGLIENIIKEYGIS